MSVTVVSMMRRVLRPLVMTNNTMSGSVTSNTMSGSVTTNTMTTRSVSGVSSTDMPEMDQFQATITNHEELHRSVNHALSFYYSINQSIVY